MIDGKRKRGRPMKPAVEGKRYAVTLRLSGDAKRKIEDRANRSGLTQSQAAEAIIVSTFEREGLLPEVLELAYGRPLAGLLMALAKAMRETGENLAFLANLNIQTVDVLKDWPRDQ